MNIRPVALIAGSVVSIVLALLLAVVVYWRIEFGLAYKEAWTAYVESRGSAFSDPNSMAFATRGIRFGDTEEDVDEAMRGATLAKKYAPSPSNPTNTQFVKYYRIEYRPGLDIPVAGQDYQFIYEIFWVLFDEQGRAFQLERILFVRGDVERTGIKVYDLRSGAEIKGEALTL